NAQRRGDIRGGEPTGGHLIKQRLKEMEITAINQRDLYRRTFQRTRGVQSAKPTTDNHNVRHLPSAFSGVCSSNNLFAFCKSSVVAPHFGHCTWWLPGTGHRFVLPRRGKVPRESGESGVSIRTAFSEL